MLFAVALLQALGATSKYTSPQSAHSIDGHQTHNKDNAVSVRHIAIKKLFDLVALGERSARSRDLAARSKSSDTLVRVCFMQAVGVLTRRLSGEHMS